MTKIGFKESMISRDNYFLWRLGRSKRGVEKINKIIPLINKRVLEIGCGYGAMTALLSKNGAKVEAVEIDEAKIEYARKKLGAYKDVRITKVKDEILPFKNDSFDVVILFDVIEHVNIPRKTIAEAYRVLKKNGILYVEFTPFYSVTGHHLYDFAKWPIHILPVAIIKKFVYGKKIRGFLTHDDFWAQFLSLNKLKINDFKKMVSGFTVIEERHIIKYPEIFELNIGLLKYLGGLSDFFTMSFEGLYRKK